MSCSKYRSWIPDAALGELSEARHAELGAHLASCSSCRAALERERALFAAVDAGLASSVTAEPSPEFAARVRQRIAEDSPVNLWPTGWIPVTAAGALAALMLALWLPNRSVAPLSVAGHPISTPGAPIMDAAKTAPATAPHGPAGAPHAAPSAGNIRPASSAPPRKPPFEILVDPREQQAVRLFYLALLAGRLDAAAALKMEIPESLADGFKPLSAPDLKFDPLNLPPLEGTQGSDGSSGMN